MAALARSRRDAAGRLIYDAVHNSHILPVLQQHESQFDLFLAADVFIYVGALDEIFPATARALRPGGLLAFSLERHDGPEDFILQHRFAHHLAYIRRLAAACGLIELAAQTATLRTDVPPGWLVVLRKSAS
jgi:predicted TPR repeat methyltransferase